MKVVIAGSRTITNYSIIEFNMRKIKGVTEVISGTADGPDKLGERWAEENNIPVKRMPADWSKGKSGGPIRNRKMAEYTDSAVIFWDGKSKGTTNMIKEMERLNKPYLLIEVTV